MRTLRTGGGNRRPFFRTLGIACALLLGMTGCASGNGSRINDAPGKATNTATMALPPNTAPNWIWPFAPIADFSVTNISSLQQLLFRPLYWFGNDGKAEVNDSLSLAAEPVYGNGGKTVTIKLKDYGWSNGTPVTSADVMFWFNMAKAEKTNFAAYVPGQFPDNIVSASAPDARTVVFTTDKAYSREWFLYNQLSQITPMPQSWDMTGTGAKGTCSTQVSGCPAVYDYLVGQSMDLPTYASNPLWQVVDGPWTLKSFNSDGHITFVPNTKYSGPVKATLAEFREVPFTTDSAEFNVLGGAATLDVGYLPSQDLSSPRPANSTPDQAGPNPLDKRYTLAPWNLYGINYFPINFNNPTVGPIFKQLYFRQALQSVVDQPDILTAAAKNYGFQTTGPVPLFPDGPLVSPLEKDNPYPFSIDAARKYLTDNGWGLAPGAAATCRNPGTGAGQCGAGIAAGQELAFTLLYSSGQQGIEVAMESMKSNAAQARHHPEPDSRAVQLRHRHCRPVLRGHLHLGNGQLGRRLGVRARLLPDGRDDFPDRGRFQQRKLLEPRDRQVDPRHHHPKRHRGDAGLRGCGGQGPSGGVAAELHVQPDHDRQRAEGRHPAEPLRNITPEAWHY